MSLKGESEPSRLKVFYNTVEVSSEREYSYLFTNSFLILLAWLILPFLVAGVVVFYLLRFCIRRLMVMRGSLVEEVEIVAASASSPTVPSDARLANPTIEYPDSAKTQIKEHI